MNFIKENLIKDQSIFPLITMTFSLVASLGRVSSKGYKFSSSTVLKNLPQRYANLKHLLRSQT